MRSLCDLPARTVLHNGLCSLSFAYVCVADRGQMLDPHKNCPHTPCHECHDVLLSIILQPSCVMSTIIGEMENAEVG